MVMTYLFAIQVIRADIVNGLDGGTVIVMLLLFALTVVMLADNASGQNCGPVMILLLCRHSCHTRQLYKLAGFWLRDAPTVCLYVCTEGNARQLCQKPRVWNRDSDAPTICSHSCNTSLLYELSDFWNRDRAALTVCSHSCNEVYSFWCKLLYK